MAEIKFHKADGLPSTLNSTHDGIWFILQGDRSFKAYIVSGGEAVPLNYDDGISYVAGEGIDITSAVISLKEATDSEIGGTKIWKGTQAQYDAIPVKDADTLYFIEDLGGSSNMVVYNIDKDLLIPTGTFNVSIFDVRPSGINIVGAINWEITWKESLNELHKLSNVEGFENLHIHDNPIGFGQHELRGHYKGNGSFTIEESYEPKLILYYE